MPVEIPISKDLRKLLQFGSGVGVEIGAEDLEVVAARVRPNGVTVLGRLEIADFATRPAAEWGGEYARFLKPLGLSHVSATVLLPRRDVIVRHLVLPGVSGKDVEGAIRFQLDSLHPYGEDEVSWGWSPLAYGAVLVGIARRSTVAALSRSVLGRGHQGGQFHLFRGGGALRRPFERRRLARRIPGARPVRPAAAWKCTAKARPARCSPRNFSCPRNGQLYWGWPNCGWPPKPRL